MVAGLPGSDPDRRHVVLLGLMASGKSTVGRLVADRLDRRLIDNDEELLARVGRTAAEHATLHGLEHLHGLEADVLRSSLAASDPAVITAAASVGDRPDLVELVAGSFVVWLDVDPAVLTARIPPQGDHRPFDDEALTVLRTQRQQRAPNFAAAADLVLSSSDQTPEDLADQVLDAFQPSG